MSFSLIFTDMRMFVLLAIMVTSLSIYAFEFDTVNGDLYINRGGSTVFMIPIKSINLEFSETKVKSKLGSYHFKYKRLDHSDSKVITFAKSKVSIADGSESLILEIDKEGLINIHCSSGFVCFSFQNLPNELFYGGGFQFSNVELNGHQILNLCEENGIGRNDSPISKWTKLVGINGEEYSTYYPVPFMVSTGNRGISIESRSMSIMNVKSNVTDVMISGKETSLQIFCEESVLRMVQSFSLKNGRGQNIPQWAFGNIIGIQGGTACVKEIIDPMIEAGLPIEAIWIQDWVGKRETKIGSRLDWKWQLDSTYKGFFDYAEANSFKVLGYINPFFAEVGKYTEEGLENEYFIMEFGRAKEFDFGGMSGYMLDLFNPEAFDWMKDIMLNNLIEVGFDGWMADFAEWYPIDQISDIRIHNDYVHEWVKLNHEVRENATKELFIFHRSGNLGSAKYSQASWCGDQMTNYGLNDGLPSVISAMISGGLTGLPPTHSDIGGYTSLKKPFLKKILRSKDLLEDWIVLEAFTPFFRSHEGLLPDENLQVYSSEIQDLYIKMALVNKSLLPYFYELYNDYKLNGVPIIRHAVLNNEESIPYSFYVGKDIFIEYTQNIPHALNSFRFVEVEREENRIHVSIRKGSEIEKVLFNKP